MQTKALFLLSILALTTLAGCDQINADQQSQPAELPIAPVLPAYPHLSPNPPPPAPMEIPPQLDLQHQAWRPGYYAYDDNQFTWVPGAVIQKPAFTAVWMPDHWEKREFGWAFVCGYWQ